MKTPESMYKLNYNKNAKVHFLLLVFSFVFNHDISCIHLPLYHLSDVLFQKCRCILHICIISFIQDTFTFITMSDFWASLELGLKYKIPNHIKTAFR